MPDDQPKTCLTDGSPVTEEALEIDPGTGMQKGYVVLCPEERAKGFVRTVRNVYRHVGSRPTHPLRTLTPEEQKQYVGYGFVAFEQYPESERPKTGRYWTDAELCSGCNHTTAIGDALAETYARDPKFYGATFCSHCRQHFPVAQFVWDGTTEVVGS